MPKRLKDIGKIEVGMTLIDKNGKKGKIEKIAGDPLDPNFTLVTINGREIIWNWDRLSEKVMVEGKRMEKVKVTKAQAEAIEEYKEKVMGVFDFLHDLAGTHHINSHGEEQEEEAIKLMKAFTDGYEVEPEFKVGDWIYIDECATHTNKEHVRKIVAVNPPAITLDDNWNIGLESGHIRHATPSEIKQEKERRFWAGLGREVNEYKKGDIAININRVIAEPFVVINDCVVDYLKLVCPVENRLDVKTNE